MVHLYRCNYFPLTSSMWIFLDVKWFWVHIFKCEFNFFFTFQTIDRVRFISLKKLLNYIIILCILIQYINIDIIITVCIVDIYCVQCRDVHYISYVRHSCIIAFIKKLFNKKCNFFMNSRTYINWCKYFPLNWVTKKKIQFFH